MVVNITGSFLIGLVMVLLTERFQLHPNYRLVFVVGFLGGYTTFSSFAYETLTLVRGGGMWLGFVNVLGSVLFGFAAVWLGTILAARW